MEESVNSSKSSAMCVVNDHTMQTNIGTGMYLETLLEQAVKEEDEKQIEALQDGTTLRNTTDSTNKLVLTRIKYCNKAGRLCRYKIATHQMGQLHGQPRHQCQMYNLLATIV